MSDWDAQQYLKFEDERTRGARDLLAQIPVQDARGVVDIGCGPGNSTELLARRWPQAKITGIDTSADMLRQARERLPQHTFIEANISHWAPPAGTDVLFANAIFQWVPDHLTQLKRLTKTLQQGGVLGVSEAYRQIALNLHLLIHVCLVDDTWRGGTRKRFISEVRELTGAVENGRPVTHLAYRADEHGRALQLQPSAELLGELRAFRGHG